LDDIDCKNYEEARKAEQSYIDEYNIELNSTNAYSVKYKEENEKEYTYKEYKEQTKFNCVCCSYYCRRKYDLNQHLATLKHKKTEMIINYPATKFPCLCGKEYKYIQ
jgi:hypothetical protein